MVRHFALLLALSAAACTTTNVYLPSSDAAAPDATVRDADVDESAAPEDDASLDAGADARPIWDAGDADANPPISDTCLRDPSNDWRCGNARGFQWDYAWHCESSPGPYPNCETDDDTKPDWCCDLP